MEWQLSAGQGPAECQLAVAKLLAALMKEFPDIRVIQAVSSSRPGTYRSVRIGTWRDLSFLEGSVQWICPSPYRPGHKRKNWFVDISPCAPLPLRQGMPERVRFETFRSGGKGGQHVNKVETGVRAVDMESGLAAVSTEARSQQMNKRIALDRLCGMIALRGEADRAGAESLNRLEHLRLQRGGPVRIYRGPAFDLDPPEK